MMRGSLTITIAFLLGTIGAAAALNSVHEHAHAQGLDAGAAVGAGSMPPPPPPATLGDGSAVGAAPATVPTPVSTQPTMQAAPPAPAAPAVPDLDATDVERLWRGGAFLAAGAVALYLLLVNLRKVDPKRAFYWTSGAAALEIVVEAVAVGVTPTINMWVIGAVTLIGLLARGPGSLLTGGVARSSSSSSDASAAPAPIHDALTAPAPLAPATGTVVTRDPERGAARGDMLTMLVGLVLVSVIVGGALSSCATASTAARSAADLAGDVIDCTLGETPAITYQFAPMADAVIRYATGADGSIDPEPIREAARNARSAAAGCLWAEAFARAISPPAAPAGTPQVAPLVGDPDALRATFDAIRGAQLGGASFKTASGVL